MVELKDFVSESLKQIIDGISSAQGFAEGKNASVNPAGIIHMKDNYYIVDRDDPEIQSPIPQFIEFDVAVTVSEGTEAKAGIGVFAGAVGLGTQGKAEDANITVSRIKFSVPILLPQQHQK